MEKDNLLSIKCDILLDLLELCLQSDKFAVEKR